MMPSTTRAGNPTLLECEICFNASEATNLVIFVFVAVVCFHFVISRAFIVFEH